MLTRDALNSALPLTEALDSARMFLTPVENTPLAAMVKATRSDEKFVSVNGPIFTPQIDEIEYIANAKDPVLGFSEHDKVMDEITEVAIKAVQGHINFARSVVAPAVQELVEKTQASLGEFSASALLGMEVVVWNPPKPLLNASLETSVRRFETATLDVPALIMRLPSQTPAEIVELMQTGSANLDGDIRDWAASKGDTFFINLWENLFQQRQAGLNDARPQRFTDFFISKEEGMDYALAVYLIARRLSEQAPLEGTEMSLQQYEQTMVEFRNQAGARLVAFIEELNRDIKAQILVRSASERCTVVNGPVYKDWIEAGGENEILFGNMLDLPGVVTVELLNEKAATLRSIWHRHAALTATVENNRRFLRTKQILLRHFQDMMKNVPEDEIATVTNRTVLMKLFTEQLDLVKEADLSDLYRLCLRLVCRSRFHLTDAERILEGIDRVQKENPNIDIREAAAVSIIEYIAFWVAAQFKVNAR